MMIKELALSISQLLGISASISLLVAMIICGVWSVIFYFWQKRLDSQYQKQIENLKTKNEKINYITKIQFDAEYKMYQELSESTFKTVVKSYSLFPPALDNVPSDKDERKIEYEKRYKEAFEELCKFQNLVFKYAAFIKEDLYKQFDEIRLLIQLNVNFFPDIRLRDDIQINVDVETKCYNRTKDIIDKQDILIKNLRNYLQSLKIAEDN